MEFSPVSDSQPQVGSSLFEFHLHVFECSISGFLTQADVGRLYFVLKAARKVIIPGPFRIRLVRNEGDLNWQMANVH